MINLSICSLNLKPISASCLLFCSFELVQSFDACILVVVARVLEHDEGELLIRGDHDLVHFWTDTDEGDLLVLVQVFDCEMCMSGELGNEGSVFNGLGQVHGGLDGNTLLVDNNDTADAHMGVYTIKRLFNFLRHFVSAQINKLLYKIE